MTEGNIGGGAPPSTVKGGLWLADYVGSMMSEGAGATYYFHYMPYAERHVRRLSAISCRSTQNYKVKGYPPQYLATQLITKEWVQPVDAPHKLFKASSDVNDAAGNVLVTAYAVERPDGQWSVMLVNRDQYNDHAVKVAFAGAEASSDRHFSGQVDRITFGSNEYQWHQEGSRRPCRPRRSGVEVDDHGGSNSTLPASEGVDHRAARTDRMSRPPSRFVGSETSRATLL